MALKIKQLFLMVEEENELKKVDFTNCNADVIVFLDNGEKYVASFFTYLNIEAERKKNQAKGGFLNGKYFYINNLILIDECSEENVRSVVKYLIDEGDFQMIFKRISNEVT